MSSSVELHPQAVLEMEEAYHWYEKRSEGLGLRFIASVNKRLKEIAADPERYAKKRGDYRETRVDKFPFVIIYEVLKKEQIVFVSYVFHLKRNPRIKYMR